jgi:hypothetical protein
MTDAVIALILIISFTAVLALVRFFKTVDGDFWRAARTPLVSGLAAGLLLRVLHLPRPMHVVAVGVVLTLAALYVRLTGDESEPTDGMILGALCGAAASLPLVLNGGNELRAFAECILAGAVAGFGITIAVFHVADKVRQVGLDVVTAAAAIGAAWLVELGRKFGATDLHLSAGAAALIPLLVIITVFKQYPDIRAELRHEASLGFIEDSDVRSTANPFLRLGRAGWSDAHAHREFVRIANRIALRKRQQRNRPEEQARLYQLEIIKLRMHLQEMSRIDRATVHELHSDTMRASE